MSLDKPSGWLEHSKLSPAFFSDYRALRSSSKQQHEADHPCVGWSWTKESVSNRCEKNSEEPEQVCFITGEELGHLWDDANNLLHDFDRPIEHGFLPFAGEEIGVLRQQRTW